MIVPATLSEARREQYARDPAAFIDDHIRLNEKGQRWSLAPHQRRVLALAFQWSAAGALLLRLLLWSEVKKSGKTFLASCLALWWAFTNASTEVIIAANDLDQATGRVFRTMTALAQWNAGLGASIKPYATELHISNGTVITAIPSDYRGVAGSRHSLAVFDELWGYDSENAERLFEELTPPPTEPNAWVLVVSYAGFTGESKLLEALYQRGQAGERLDAGLEVTRSDEQITFWSHTPRMPWQTETYYAQQQRSLRPSTFARLHRNEWVSAESSFITAEQWDSTICREHRPLRPGPEAQAFTLVAGIDAGWKSDCAGAIAVFKDGPFVVVAAHKLWTPAAGTPVDLEDVERWIRELCAQFQVSAVLCDPWQFARSLQALPAARIPVQEYPQTEANVTRAGSTLWELITTGALVTYPSEDLRRHALNAAAVEKARGVHITKASAARKVDLLVALGIACVGAVTMPDPPPRLAWI